MPLWRRKNDAPQREDDSDVVRRIDERQAEAEAALAKAHAQAREQRSISSTLKRIREENHLSEIWGQGMGA